MKKLYVVPYKVPLDSIAELKKLLGSKITRVRPDSTTHKQVPSALYLNWGNSQWPAWTKTDVGFLNPAPIVGNACNKLKTFLDLDIAGVSTVEFTVDKKLAQNWLSSGETVIGRELLKASGGRGIIIYDKPDMVVANHRLYTKYKKKRHEYRVHVFNGSVIDVQWKRRMSDKAPEEIDVRIRNHDRGWVFCREDITEPKDLRGLALTAVKQMKLFFGAVDIIWNERDNKSYVLEINTAPGITGTTAQNYANAIELYLKG